jgi:multidrug efflux pump
MHISKPFIERPVATSLLSAAILLAGGVAYFSLPVAPLPKVDFPTLVVSASLPGASPETMASSVATPLERSFGRIAGVTEMTSSSQLGSTSITLQLDLDRDINAAARDVQSAINAAAGQLPTNLPSLPRYREANPSDAPILMLGLTSNTIPQSRLYDISDSILAQKLSQVDGVGQVFVGGSSKPAVRVDLNPLALAHYEIGLAQVRAALQAANANSPKGLLEDKNNRWVIFASDQLLSANKYLPLIVAYRGAAPSACGTLRTSTMASKTFGMAGSRMGFRELRL